MTSDRHDMLTMALYLALTAPTDRQVDDAAGVAEIIAEGMAPGAVERAKNAARQRWEAEVMA